MFETFEHRADIGVRGYGKSPAEAFSECAKAMFSIACDLEKVDGKDEVKVEAEAADLEQLLVNFLNHLLYLSDVKGMLFKSFALYIMNGGKAWKLEGKALGEKANNEKHHIRGSIKAASYHQLKVSEEKGKWVAQCVVDV